MNTHLRTILVWLVFLGVVVIAYQIFATANAQRTDLDASEFYRLVDSADIAEVNISPDASGYDITGKFKNPRLVATGQQVSNFLQFPRSSDRGPIEAEAAPAQPQAPTQISAVVRPRPH